MLRDIGGSRTPWLTWWQWIWENTENCWGATPNPSLVSKYLAHRVSVPINPPEYTEECVCMHVCVHVWVVCGCLCAFVCMYTSVMLGQVAIHKIKTRFLPHTTIHLETFKKENVIYETLRGDKCIYKHYFKDFLKCYLIKNWWMWLIESQKFCIKNIINKVKRSMRKKIICNTYDR